MTLDYDKLKSKVLGDKPDAKEDKADKADGDDVATKLQEAKTAIEEAIALCRK